MLQNDGAGLMSHPAGKPRQWGTKGHGLQTSPDLRVNRSSELMSSSVLGGAFEFLGF